MPTAQNRPRRPSRSLSRKFKDLKLNLKSHGKNSIGRVGDGTSVGDPFPIFERKEPDHHVPSISPIAAGTRASFMDLSPDEPPMHQSNSLAYITKNLFISGSRREGSRRITEPTDSLRRPSTSWRDRASSMTMYLSRRPVSQMMNYNYESPIAEDENTESLCEREKLSLPPLVLSGGVAARAAAAAQNEANGSSRTQWPSRVDSLLRAPDSIADSESGIGIDAIDPQHRPESLFSETGISRRDPSTAMPKELMLDILSYLDVKSLAHASEVSRRWHHDAQTPSLWRQVFNRAYCCELPIRSDEPLATEIGGVGLGTKKPNQDWKRMCQVRRSLDERWKAGSAAAHYLEGHTDSVYCVQFDEHKIITGSRDRTLRVWDVRTYRCLQILGVPKTPSSMPATYEPLVNDMEDVTKPLKSIYHRTIRKLPVEIARDGLYHHGSILCLQFDETMMVTGSSDRTLLLWDITPLGSDTSPDRNGNLEYKAYKRLRHHSAGVLDVCFDAKIVVSCSKDALICLWDRATGNLLNVLRGHLGPVNAVQLRGSSLVSCSGDGLAKLWNLTSNTCVKEFASRARGMACVEFSPDGRTILAAGNDNVIFQFDANTGELVRELEGHKLLVRSLHLDWRNARVVSGSYDTCVKVFDVRCGELVVDLVGWTTSWMLAAKSDYRRIVATSQDGRVLVVDFGWGVEGVELLEGTGREVGEDHVVTYEAKEGELIDVVEGGFVHEEKAGRRIWVMDD
ncbi:hypothetical protein MMC25_000941 [Agyrium rufum]|nr:hypothetical protein [Agyrium rufum]